MGLLIFSLVCLLFHASSNPSKIVHGTGKVFLPLFFFLSWLQRSIISTIFVILLCHNDSSGGVNSVDRRGGGGGGHGGHGGGGHAHGGGGGLRPLVIPVYAGGAHRTTQTHNGQNNTSCNCAAHSQLASTIFALFLLLCF